LQKRKYANQFLSVTGFDDRDPVTCHPLCPGCGSVGTWAVDAQGQAPDPNGPVAEVVRLANERTRRLSRDHPDLHCKSVVTVGGYVYSEPWKVEYYRPEESLD
jgi:hypothetical protein